MLCCHSQGCRKSGNGQEKILQGRGKVREFYFKSGKIEVILRNWFKIIGGWNYTIIFLNKGGKFVDNLSLSLSKWKDSCKLRLQAATRCDILYLFGQGNLYFIRVNRKIVLSDDACGNHEGNTRQCHSNLQHWMFFTSLFRSVSRHQRRDEPQYT